MVDKKKRRVSMRPKPEPTPEIRIDPAELGSDKAVSADWEITEEGRRVFMGAGTVQLNGVELGQVDEFRIDIFPHMTTPERTARSFADALRRVGRSLENPNTPTAGAGLDTAMAEITNYLQSLANGILRVEILHEQIELQSMQQRAHISGERTVEIEMAMNGQLRWAIPTGCMGAVASLMLTVGAPARIRSNLAQLGDVQVRNMQLIAISTEVYFSIRLHVSGRAMDQMLVVDATGDRVRLTDAEETHGRSPEYAHFAAVASVFRR